MELTSWIELTFFDLSANWPLSRVNLFDSFGFEDLGLGEINLTPPYDADGLLEVTRIEDSFINWLRNLDWLDLLTTPGFYGVSFSSI